MSNSSSIAANSFIAANRRRSVSPERPSSSQDFYHLRASITKHLIEHHGLDAVAVEADWPDACRVNRFVLGEGRDGDANAALPGFERFPGWMWRNTEVLSFVRWLREWNDRHPHRKVGFYGERGELNLGQLLRERYGADAKSVGFTTYDGTVTAASEWDAEAGRKFVRPAFEGSIEALFHDVGIAQFVLHLADERLAGFATPLLERAIGVIYRPQSERQSHYFQARVTEQFDALIHIDRSTALVPLEPSIHWWHEEVPETYPTGL